MRSSDRVELTFLGSGDAFGSGARFNTCFLVEAQGQSFLIDCGGSALLSLKQFRVDTNHLDSILITHMHGDHFGGLPILLLEAELFFKRSRPLRLIGPPGMEKGLRAAQEALYPGSSTRDPGFDLQIVEYEPRQTFCFGRDDDFSGMAHPVVHGASIDAFGLRLEIDERVIAYSGDTEWTDELLELSRAADLFICECSSYDIDIKGHLNYTSILAWRESLACKRLILTHLGPDVIELSQSLEIECARDGLKIDV